jgi:hypothetical protein
VKTIQGRFVNSRNRPVSCGWIRLQLESAAEIDNDLNIGVPLASPVPLTEAEKEEFKWANQSYTFTLDSDGRIPPGTEIWGNDELTGDTWYHVSVLNSLPYPAKYHWEASLKIIGPGPVDLNAIVPEGFVPEPEPEHEPEPIAPSLPSKRVSGANYSGFYGGVVYPAGEGDGMTIEREERYPFYLPFKAVVRQAAIFVDVPHVGRSATVTVGLEDVVSGKRVCTTIKASKQGIASAFFDEAVILNQGEHILSWSADSTALKVRSAVKTVFDRKVVIGPAVYFSA